MADRSGGQPTNRRGGLGRGLASLIPTATETGGSSAQSIAIESIRPNPYQPRTEWNQDKLSELADSIRTHGLIQPLIVSLGRSANTFVLIAGERRLRAAEMAGLTEVPVVIKDVTPQALLELALVENLVRSDLSPLEEAQAYRQLIEDFGLTQGQVAERVGRSRVSITNTLRLLNLPDAIQSALQQGAISEGHARALLALPTAADQVGALQTVLAKGMSVRQTEEYVRKWSTPVEPVVRPTRDEGRLTWQQTARLQKVLETKVAIRQDDATGAGTIAIHFYDNEQLESLLNRLAGVEDF
ncbi:MAG TPA: ParB/RepB/Spo0J family partition protein [Thermomicrobiales bacterium]|mgnify:CR=1 FL=1|nr:ParB/RepB/Spo0J family partition protein [Thermomicrobiales bacterium]HRA46695.1 ParB/RepB/Spo0J family partition protein [Thermomicrobiales bacterium]